MSDYLQVSTTADSRETAMDILRSAVESRLAACGQVLGPATSVFWHQGQLGEAEEWQVFLKTTTRKYPELEKHLISRHSWENPEVTASAIAAGAVVTWSG